VRLDAVARDDGLRERAALVLRRYTPRIELATPDAFFVDLTGTTLLHGAACEAAAHMRRTLRDELGGALTLGIGTSRTVAHAAGGLGGRAALAEVLPGHESEFLAHLPLERLPGVSEALARALARSSVRSVGQLRRRSRAGLYARLGRAGLVLHAQANGLDDDPVEEIWIEQRDDHVLVRPPRALRREGRFEPPEIRRTLVDALLSVVVERAAARLRAHEHRAGAIEVRLRVAGGGTHAAPVALRVLRAPTDVPDTLARHARALLHGLLRRRVPVSRVGVTLLRLTPRARWCGRPFRRPPPRPPPPAVNRSSTRSSGRPTRVARTASGRRGRWSPRRRSRRPSR
jgi:DNA polymerase-4